MPCRTFSLQALVNSWLVLVWLLAGAFSQAAALAEDLTSLWPVDGRNEFRQGAKAGVGFSLVYDGKSVGPILPREWRSETAAETAEATFRHASGLTLVRHARRLPEFGAVEYTLRLKNDSQTELPALTAIQAMDLSFAGDMVRRLSVVTCGGGGADATFPPKDFAVTRTALGPQKDSLRPEPGRSRLRRTGAALTAAPPTSGRWRA